MKLALTFRDCSLGYKKHKNGFYKIWAARRYEISHEHAKLKFPITMKVLQRISKSVGRNSVILTYNEAINHGFLLLKWIVKI